MPLLMYSCLYSLFVVKHCHLAPAAPAALCSHKPGSTDKCEPFTQAIIDDWVKAFIPCLSYAVKAGFDIAFTPHLDDGLASGVWRNAQLINPIAK
jgi:hypothetical protein